MAFKGCQLELLDVYHRVCMRGPNNTPKEIHPCIHPWYQHADKRQVAHSAQAHIIERLASYTMCVSIQHNNLIPMSTYRKKSVWKIHTHKYSVTNPCIVTQVAQTDQQERIDVMRNQFPVILTRCLDLQDKDLLQPKCKLQQVVILERLWIIHHGIIAPKVGHVEPPRRIVHHILSQYFLSRSPPQSALTIPAQELVV